MVWSASDLGRLLGTTSHSTGRRRPRCEGVPHDNAVKAAAVLEIFGQQCRAPGTTRALHEQGIPKRDAVKAVKIDGTENIVKRDEDDDELAKQLDLASSDVGGNTELFRGGREILLEHLS